MINLDNYPMLDRPVVTVYPGYRGKDMAFIAETNYVNFREIPWKVFAVPYGGGKMNIPAEFAGKIPENASTGDTFLYSPFDQETVDKILYDAHRDADLSNFRELEEAKLQLRREIFPNTVET